jgi:hypothetical protein
MFPQTYQSRAYQRGEDRIHRSHSEGQRHPQPGEKPSCNRLDKARSFVLGQKDDSAGRHAAMPCSSRWVRGEDVCHVTLTVGWRDWVKKMEGEGGGCFPGGDAAEHQK